MKDQTIQAIKKAILNGNPCYKGIVLPSPQKIGTTFQQVTYALIKAQKLYEEHFTEGLESTSGNSTSKS